MEKTLSQNQALNQPSASANSSRQGIWRRYVYAQTTAYSNFSGRADRADFWSFFILAQIFSYLCAFVIAFLGTLADVKPETVQALSILFLFVAFDVPMLSASCRRLHDINLSGWWQLSFILVIPAVILLLWPSDEGSNRFGAPVA